MRTVGSSANIWANCWRLRSSRPKSSSRRSTALKFGDGGAGTKVGELRHSFGPGGQAGEDFQIAADDVFDAGVTHFDDDPLARWKLGAMDLADRGAGQRQLFEIDEQVFDGLTELGFDGFGDFAERIGGRVILQLGELFGQRDADDVGARAENLAELDERGAQFGQRQANARFAVVAAQRRRRRDL